jgi:hypothetical protein
MKAPVAVDYGPEEAAMRAPIRFTADGAVHLDILDAYWRCGEGGGARL